MVRIFLNFYFLVLPCSVLDLFFSFFFFTEKEVKLYTEIYAEFVQSLIYMFLIHLFIGTLINEIYQHIWKHYPTATRSEKEQPRAQLWAVRPSVLELQIPHLAKKEALPHSISMAASARLLPQSHPAHLIIPQVGCHSFMICRKVLFYCYVQFSSFLILSSFYFIKIFEDVFPLS